MSQFIKKIQAIRQKNRKPPKNYTLMGWIRLCFRVLGASLGASICSANLTLIYQAQRITGLVSDGGLNFYIYNLGFLACLVIAMTDLYDIINWGYYQQNIHVGGMCDGI